MRYLFLFEFVLIFFSCTKRLDLDLPYEDKLVVNAFLDDENGLTLNLSKTLNPVGNYSKDFDNKITDAQVFLIENFTKEYLLLHTNRGNYELIDTNFRPQEGKSYSIKVLHPNYSIVTSKNIIYPKKFDLEFINMEQHKIDDKPSDFFKISFKIKGYNNEDINMLFSAKDDIDNYELKYSLNPDYNLVNNQCDVNLVNSIKALTYDCFTNSILQYFVSFNEFDYPDPLKFDLMYTNLDFIKYLQSIDNFDPFNSSLVVWMEGTKFKSTYTNINNGWGIFYSKRIISFEL
jgi:hypothetical protein